MFSVGTVLLNPDGTPQTDNTGATIATYRQHRRQGRGPGPDRLDLRPAERRGPDRQHQSRLDPADGDVRLAIRHRSQEASWARPCQPTLRSRASVDAVVDTVFNHPNTGPYICKRLIQQLTLANPTPGLC
ncbi:hypothetical protein ACRAWD_04500 [Caulobacter segnis]